jgi:hypothetical protein
MAKSGALCGFSEADHSAHPPGAPVGLLGHSPHPAQWITQQSCPSPGPPAKRSRAGVARVQSEDGGIARKDSEDGGVHAGD